MKRCSKCDSAEIVAGEQPFVLDVGERSFEGPVEGWRCKACGEQYYDGMSLESFEQVAAAWLAQHGVRTPEELKFMRKAAGVRAADLAEWLGVTPETVSHWETGKHPPDIASRTTIAAIVLDALKGETTTRDRLKAQGTPDSARKVRLKAKAA